MSDAPTNPPEPQDVPSAPDAPGIDPSVVESKETPAEDAGPAPAAPASQSATGGSAPSQAKVESPSAPPTVHVGRVMRVTSEDVSLQLSDGREGQVAIAEFAGQPLPKDGDEVSVIIEREEADNGTLVLSKRHADELGFWESVKPGDVLEGVVTGMNKGGLDVDIGGARAFLPSSQVDTHRLKDISTLIGEHVQCVVTQVDRTTRDIVASRKKFLDQKRKAKRKEALAELQEGEIRTGTVSNIVDYGAFVDLGGIAGLLHISDMSWGRVRDAKEVVQPGQQLRVKVTKINQQTGKVSLSLKQLKPNPWDGIEERYPDGKKLKAKIARMTDFGAFLELEEGVDALLPVSEMSWNQNVRRPGDVVKVGDEVEVAILNVDVKKQRISVSLKLTQDNPWATMSDRFPANTKVQGTVKRLADFGAFVELEPGVEGLIHISELSDKRVRSVADAVKEEQQVEVRVLKVDPDAQRISLSMRSEAKAEAEAAPARKKKRKKPLRGGLDAHFQW